MGPTDDKLELVQVMAWLQPPEPKMIQFIDAYTCTLYHMSAQRTLYQQASDFNNPSQTGTLYQQKV